MKQTLSFLILVMIIGCTPEKRLARLVQRHPSLVTTDTLIRPVLVPVPEVRAETVFRAKPSDTVILENGRLEIRYERFRDTVKISGRCNPDTLRILDTVIVPRIKLVPAPPSGDVSLWSLFRHWKVILAVMGGILLLVS